MNDAAVYPRFPLPFIDLLMADGSSTFGSVLALLSVDKREANGRYWFIVKYARFVTGSGTGFNRDHMSYIALRFKGCQIIDQQKTQWQKIVNEFEERYSFYSRRQIDGEYCSHPIFHDSGMDGNVWQVEVHYCGLHGQHEYKLQGPVCATREIAVEEAIHQLWRRCYGVFDGTTNLLHGWVRQLAKLNHAESQLDLMIARLRAMVQCIACFNDMRNWEFNFPRKVIVTACGELLTKKRQFEG